MKFLKNETQMVSNLVIVQQASKQTVWRKQNCMLRAAMTVLWTCIYWECFEETGTDASSLIPSLPISSPWKFTLEDRYLQPNAVPKPQPRPNPTPQPPPSHSNFWIISKHHETKRKTKLVTLTNAHSKGIQGHPWRWFQIRKRSEIYEP